MKVNCPTCEKSVTYSTDNPCRPFCSERCKLIDLGEWASEGYKVPVEPTLDDYSSGIDPNEFEHTPTRH